MWKNLRSRTLSDEEDGVDFGLEDEVLDDDDEENLDEEGFEGFEEKVT